jgi:hypothetical protein
MTEVCITTDNFNEVMSHLFDHYQKNKIATLDEKETEMLNNVSEKLESIFRSQDIQFNTEDFQTLVKRLYPKKNSMLGGDGEEEIIVSRRNPRRKNVFYKYDFFAILGLIVSIYLLYLSFIQLNKLSCDITGNSVGELTSIITDEITESIKSLNKEELSYLNYILKFFIHFSKNIISRQKDKLYNIIQTTMSVAVPNFMDDVNSVCGIKRNDDTILGIIESSMRLAIHPTITTQCITETTQTLIEEFQNNQKTKLNLLLTKLNTNFSQIHALVSYGTTLGFASISYMYLRIPYIYYGMLNNDDNNDDIEYGGTRKRRHKKSKKSKKRNSLKKRKHSKRRK